MGAEAARVIDLGEYRKKKANGPRVAVLTATAYWVPFFVWIPVWRR